MEYGYSQPNVSFGGSYNMEFMNDHLGFKNT